MTYKNINIYNDNNIFNKLYILNNNIYNIDEKIIGIIENIKDIFYKITWYNSIIKEEYYFSFDCINYYKDVERHTLLLQDKIKYINIKNNNWNEICILNYKDSKIYRKNNYCDCGTFYYENNDLIVNWEQHGNEKFYLSNADKIYYSNSYFEKHFKKIFIIDENEYFYYNVKDNYLYSFDLNNILYNVKNNNKNLILSSFINNNNENLILSSFVNNNKILYFIQNNKYTYDRKLYSYSNFELKILDNNFEMINDNDNNLKLNYPEEYNLNKNYESYINYKKDCINNNFRENDKIIFMIIDNNNNFLDLLNKIDYLQIYYNYKIIIFENIVNKCLYDKYYDYLNIIYYFNIDKTLNYLFNYDNFIQKNDIFYIYTQNYIYFNEKIRNNRLIFYDKFDINLFNSFDKNINNKYSTIKEYYEKNHKNILNITSLNDSNRNNIPKIIHFIWIGNNISEKYLEYIETWIRYHPDYHFCLWNDNNIPKLVNQELFDNATDYAMKVDILRYEIIYFLGGIYIDCDFLCIKNIDDLINNLNNFCSHESKDFITNAIFGFVREHIFLYNVIENLRYNFFSYKNVVNNNSYIPKITGPEYFTELCHIFQKNNKLNIFDTEIFYSYTFENKYHNNNIIIKKENYGIHMWGNSWNNCDDDNDEKDNNKLNFINYVERLILTNKIKSINNYDSSKNTLFKKSNNKIPIVHIVGIFFSGGIEKLMYYFNKYGNNDKYNYIILCHGFSNKNYYNVDNIISFDGVQQLLNKYLHLIKPELIIDHYSIYIENNDIMYNNINKNNIVQFMHSAILYKKDISIYNIKKCVHLYKEDDSLKHSSWNDVVDNYYTTLGCEIVSDFSFDNNNSKINTKKIIISIIGRIAEEKIPLDFLELLSNFSITNYKKFVINIYGEKDYLFSNDYLEKFNKIMYSSNINYLGFTDVTNIYKNTHILLIPSLYETGSFVCLEAYSYGIPVIARNCYGLKHLIKNDSTGFLFNNNEECFNIINNINKKKLNSMKKHIIKESLEYNIIDKIKDIENIIDENIIYKNIEKPSKNIFIITSILNCTNLELSYSKKRTVFSFSSRLRQTIKTIKSIRKYYSNSHILLCDCSDLSNYKTEELEISNMVDYYYNFYDNDLIKEAVNGIYKGHGECMILLKALDIINNLNNSYKYIFKISGRYYLNDNFDNKLFENNENVFTTWDGCDFSLCTVLYKLMYNDRTYFENVLRNSMNELIEGNSIEICIYKYFLKNINIVEKINVDGYLSTEGYKCSF